jgi:uracil-DNA glycosylase
MFKIHPSWDPIFLKYEFNLDLLYSVDKDIYPSKENVFKVFEIDVQSIKVVLLGQDPYHGPNQAHGMSFSVPRTATTPPSLRNIFNELQREYQDRYYEYKHGCLDRWFYEEKIFLLNCSLTVERGEPTSHMDIWEEFTNDIIHFISIQNTSCVFLLLGNFAKQKSSLIGDKNKIVTGVHPSPLAKGFVGSGVFRKVENALNSTINWSI